MKLLVRILSVFLLLFATTHSSMGDVPAIKGGDWQLAIANELPAHLADIHTTGYNNLPEHPYKIKNVIRTKAWQNDGQWFVASELIFRTTSLVDYYRVEYPVCNVTHCMSEPHDTSQKRGPPAFQLA